MRELENDPDHGFAFIKSCYAMKHGVLQLGSQSRVRYNYEPRLAC